MIEREPGDQLPITNHQPFPRYGDGDAEACGEGEASGGVFRLSDGGGRVRELSESLVGVPVADGADAAAGEAAGEAVGAGVAFALTDGFSAAGEGVDDRDGTRFVRAAGDGFVCATFPIVVGPTNFPRTMVPE